MPRCLFWVGQENTIACSNRISENNRSSNSNFSSKYSNDSKRRNAAAAVAIVIFFFLLLMIVLFIVNRNRDLTRAASAFYLLIFHDIFLLPISSTLKHFQTEICLFLRFFHLLVCLSVYVPVDMSPAVLASVDLSFSLDPLTLPGKLNYVFPRVEWRNLLSVFRF